MNVTRRHLLRRVVAGAGGLVLGVAALSARTQGTPEASPITSGSALLATAGDLLHAEPAPQFLALMDEKTFNASHIPGAIRLGWDEIGLEDTSEESVAAWTAKMRELMAVKGLRSDGSIVVYDEGTLFAARGWWHLAYLGYESVTVLDGGLPAWNDAQGETEAGQPALNPVEAPAIDAEVRRELLATKDEVMASLGDPDVLVVDARSQDEYDKGHIPGAVNMPYTSNAIMEDANIYLSPDQLRAMYEDLGMSAGKRAITYCSTGVRGSVATFSLRLAGFENVALYPGSWNEWTSDPDAPVE